MALLIIRSPQAYNTHEYTTLLKQTQAHAHTHTHTQTKKKEQRSRARMGKSDTSARRRSLHRVEAPLKLCQMQAFWKPIRLLSATVELLESTPMPETGRLGTALETFKSTTATQNFYGIIHPPPCSDHL